MASRFAKPFLHLAAQSLAAVAFVFIAAALVTPPSAHAQRYNGSVSVDLSVLDQLGSPRNIPQLLQPGVRSLMMPNTRPTGANGFARPTLSKPSGKTAAAAGGIRLKPPSKVKRAAPARPKAAKAAPRKPARKPVVQRPRPPAPPKIAARPPAPPKAPAVPTPPKPKPSRTAALPAPTPPPPAPAIAPPPAAPVATPPPPPPVQKPVTRPAKAPPKQTASLPPSGSRGGLAAGQQFRLSFGAGAATVQNAAATQLDDIAKALKANEALRLQLLAYSGGGAQTPSQARRLSLSRALAVRSHLIKQGVRSTRIDVRALGNKSEGGPPDRVDVIVTTR